jgi:hypothetical protein
MKKVTTMNAKPVANNGAKLCVSIGLVTSLISGCASTTHVKTNPAGAELYVDNVRQCVTPCDYTDKSTFFTSSRPIVLKLAGHKDLETTIRKSEIQVGPLVGGILVGVPFLWVKGYPAEYSFDM